MGCCICYSEELRTSILAKQEMEINFQDAYNSFNDLSLSSKSSESELTDWLDFKKFKSMTESTAVFSSFNHTKMYRKDQKILSNPGSIVDSFVVALPVSMTNHNAVK